MNYKKAYQQQQAFASGSALLSYEKSNVKYDKSNTLI